MICCGGFYTKNGRKKESSVLGPNDTHLVDAIASIPRQRCRLTVGEICRESNIDLSYLSVNVTFTVFRPCCCILVSVIHHIYRPTGHSLGCEVSVGRLQVDLRGSSSSGPMCPSVSLFKIIQLVLYKKKKKRQEEERYDRKVMDDGKEWVSELVNGWALI